MPSITYYLDPSQHDLVTPDGKIVELKRIDEKTLLAEVFIENISPVFVGFQIDKNLIFFNIKSTLAQVGVDGLTQGFDLDPISRSAQVQVLIRGIGSLGEKMLPYIKVGSAIGKLFAADDRRRVRDPDYLARMFGRADRFGKPLLSLGGLHGSDDLILDKVDGRTIAYLAIQNGRVLYSPEIDGFLPTLGKSLLANIKSRDMVRINQEWHPHLPRNIGEDELLLVRTLPLHIRTVFGRVVDSLLSEGYKHTSASILQPDTKASGDIYELYGKSKRELSDIPLEFYTLEPYREHVFFSDRDQLQICIENQSALFDAFKTAPGTLDERAATFVVKGDQLLNLNAESWIVRETRPFDFPGATHSERQALLIERYIEQQPAYPFLKSISDGSITSQGILLTRYFPSPLLKRMLLGDTIQRCLKGIYFQYPSLSGQGFFSAEDRALLHDLEKFAIPTFWVDQITNKILRYVEKADRDSGMFVPLDQVDTFLKATMVGIYGSNLLEGDFENELRHLLEGLLVLKDSATHPIFIKGKPLALVTGGGPGAMEVGNRVARQLNILSCANIVDFRHKSQSVVNEQQQNPYVQAKMTYRLDKLVERQAEFNLDFPIFLIGGIGTDFEYSLEEVRRKVGSVYFTPIILFGSPDYWKNKITPRFQENLKAGTIKGSEWLSNCFFCIQNASQGLEVYAEFLKDRLLIGREGPCYPKGFVQVGEDSLALKN